MNAFEVHPGAAGSPVLLHVPHGSRVIPDDVRRELLLDDAALAAELAHITDAHTAELAESAALAAGGTPWRFVNRLSRLVVDPERFPDEREEMRAVGMGAVYTRTTHREPLRTEGFAAEPLLERYFHPYAQAMTELVGERLRAAGRVIVLDVHSYPSRPLPYELHGQGPRPPVCLGTDPFHTPPELLSLAEKVLGRFGGTAVDSPFAGTYVPLPFHGREPRVQALMVEIRRDLYMSEPGGPAGAVLRELGAALGELVTQLS
ncbi:N-formylglutamate amidohydrolase [Streptomyces sp. KLOTTS4A1]|uniref:N-formylglutamate amidohydrolase n=1 Tax=Streptomyces sp. KLOTTS4A1 TaxID=3390996 RepID=UPI0039F4884D